MLNFKHLSGYAGFSGITSAFILKIILKCLSQQHRSGDSYSQNQQKRVLKSGQVELFSLSRCPLLLCTILKAAAPSLDYSAPVPTLSSMALPGAATLFSLLQYLWGSPGGLLEPDPSALKHHLILLIHFTLVSPCIQGNNTGSCCLSLPPGCAPTCWVTGLGSSSTSFGLFGCRSQRMVVVVFSTQCNQVLEDQGTSPGIANVGLKLLQLRKDVN